MASMQNLLDFSFDELVAFFHELNEPTSGAQELWKDLYRRFETDFDVMTNLSPLLKEKLSQSARLSTLEAIEEVTSDDSLTSKALFRLSDGKTVESTLMFFRNAGSGRGRRTVCVSSQVGCPIGCQFCATGQQGFERNLSSGEIIAQVLYFIRRLEQEVMPVGGKQSHNPLTNVVFMGMGEPLANYENVRRAISILNSPKGLNMGVRQITLSTVGLLPEMLQLSRENIQCQLALSLHAPNDSLRQRLVPIARKYALEELVSACDEYSRATNQHIYIEYALFKGVNDSLEIADELIGLLNGHAFHVNLIPCNQTAIGGFTPSVDENAIAFQKRLINGGIRTMLRLSRGSDIEAGCGQLKSRWLTEYHVPRDDKSSDSDTVSR